MRLVSCFLGMCSVVGTGCLDLDGKPTPWFLILKKNNGLDYAYFDNATPTSPGSTVTLTSYKLDDYTRSLGATLQQIVDAAGSLAVLIFNDSPIAAPLSNSTGHTTEDAPSSSTSGHTNGLLVADSNGGFWISHSLPGFPYLNDSNFAWSGSTLYGQHFICLSLDAENIELAAKQVSYLDPAFQESAIPSALASTYPTMVSVLGGQRTSGTHTQDFTTSDGQAFTHFAKSGDWGQDIFEDLIQPALQENFLWETWRRSPVMDTYCQPQYTWDSININNLLWEDAQGGALPFKYTQDHSKYGIAINATTAAGRYFCTADNNRMTSQWARGGGAHCFIRPTIYNAVTNSITNADQC